MSGNRRVPRDNGMRSLMVSSRLAVIGIFSSLHCPR
jgi:hypothetical protein